MRTFQVFMVYICLSITFWGCSGDENEPGDEYPSLQERYQASIVDAMVAEESEICADLIAIEPDNDDLLWQCLDGIKYVLVVTWTKYPDSFPEGTSVITWWGETWVTTAPEIRDWFVENYSGDTDITLRAEQLLGLPRGKGYTHFVEIWVRPEDLFRPSYDNEINDSVAQTSFPESADQEYRNWFNENIIYSYFPARFPWTRLGYTYDWGNPENEIGLSEFVIKENAHVLVKAVDSSKNYLLHTLH